MTKFSILALDPATQCGWSFFEDSYLMSSGSVSFKAGRGESNSISYFRFALFLREKLEELKHTSGTPVVGYELVSRHLSTYAAQVYGGWVSIIQAETMAAGIENVVTIPVQHVKIFATGKGNAKKEAMLDAAQKKWLTVNFTDDNQADACWIGAATYEKLTNLNAFESIKKPKKKTTC